MARALGASGRHHFLGQPMRGTLAIVLLLAAGIPAAAQTPRPAPGRAPQPQAGQMTIARLQYDGGGDWYVGPSTLPNLLAEIRQRAGIPVAAQPASVRLRDPALWDHPFLFVSGHGNILFTDEEVETLRRYLLSGGFLLVNDSYGLDPSFRREIARVFPDKELVELPRDHAIYHTFYAMPNGIPKIHEHDNKPPQGFGIFHDGRLVLFYAYESDIGDGWEDANVHNDPQEVREQAFRMGVNIFLFALAQRAG